MSDLRLTLAVGEYDHVADLVSGNVKIEGVDLTVLRLQAEEIFYRFIHFEEWDLSEMSFAKALSLASQENCWLVLLPIFISRAFRHSSIYLRSDSALTTPQQLSGKRVGIPEWAQTASIYTRGLLAHEYHVELTSIDWYQSGLNDAGRREKVRLKLPAGIRYWPVADRSLTEMLLSGELDAVLSARPPLPFLAGDGRLRRLFDNPREAELEYWKRTHIFPIMHIIVLRRELYERHRWLAMNVFKAFEMAKDRSLSRVCDLAVSSFPLPWTGLYSELSQEVLGVDFWPYGIGPNRPTLEAFAQYAFEQGVAHREVALEELFPKEVQSSFKV